MLNFDVSKKLLERMDIIADTEIFSIMLNYILNKNIKNHDSSYMDNLKLNLYFLHRKYKDNSKINPDTIVENEQQTIEYIYSIYKNIFSHMNISIFLKMCEDNFIERNVTFNDYALLTKFFDYIFIKYGVNNYLEYLYNYESIKPEIMTFGGDSLREDINKLFNGLGLNILYIALISGMTNLNYFAQFEELNSHLMFETIELKEKDRDELLSYIKFNREICKQFDVPYEDDRQLLFTKYIEESKSKNK